MVCKTCRKPVERCFDDDYQHVTLDDALACPDGDDPTPGRS